MFLWRSSRISAEDKDEKVQELRDALGPLSGRAAKYCTDGCLRRYLEARNWNVNKAAAMLQESIRWRASYKPEDIRWEEVAVEQETGKMYRASFKDRDGRTVIVMNPAKQNTHEHDGQFRHFMYILENAIFNMEDGEGKMSWLIDTAGFTRDSYPEPLRMSRDSISIMQNHYPETLGAAFLFNPPWVFELLWKVVRYFLDPKTSHKVFFVKSDDEESMRLIHQHFDPAVLPVEFGGSNAEPYDHQEFSRMMMEDDDRRARFWGDDDGDNNARKTDSQVPATEEQPSSSSVAETSDTAAVADEPANPAPSSEASR